MIPIIVAAIGVAGVVATSAITYQIFQNKARIEWIQITRDKVAVLLNSLGKLYVTIEKMKMVDDHKAKANENLRIRAIVDLSSVESEMTSLNLYFGPDGGTEDLSKKSTESLITSLNNEESNEKKNGLINEYTKRKNDRLTDMEETLYDAFEPSYGEEIKAMQNEITEIFRTYFKIEWKRSHKNYIIPISIVVGIVILAGLLVA